MSADHDFTTYLSDIGMCSGLCKSPCADLRSSPSRISLLNLPVYKLCIVIVITFYSPSCLGQETAKGSFGLRVKLPPAHLSTTHGGGFTLSL